MVDEEAHMGAPDRDPRMVQVHREARTVEEDREAHVAGDDSKGHLIITSSSQDPAAVAEAEAEEEEEDLQTRVRSNPGVRITLLTTVLPIRHSLLVLMVAVMTIHSGAVQVKDKSKYI